MCIIYHTINLLRKKELMDHAPLFNSWASVSGSKHMFTVRTNMRVNKKTCLLLAWGKFFYCVKINTFYNHLPGVSCSVHDCGEHIFVKSIQNSSFALYLDVHVQGDESKVRYWGHSSTFKRYHAELNVVGHYPPKTANSLISVLFSITKVINGTSCSFQRPQFRIWWPI